MMKLKFIYIALLIPFLLSAGTFSKVGTTAAPFLKIGVGARAVALGGNFVALADDPSALYWNPAGITGLNGMSIAGTHTEWFAGITHDAFSFIAPLSRVSALGIDLIYLSSGDIEQTTLEEQDGNGIFYNVTDLALGLTYARKLTDQFSVGVKGKYIRQTLFNEEASTFAVDFGTIFNTGFKGLRIGMNLANFGGNMQMDGSDLSVVQEDPFSGELIENRRKTESWPLPVIFRVGLAMDIVGADEAVMQSRDNRLTLAIDGNHPNDNYETIGAGLEYMWNKILALRLGYKNNHDVEKFSYGGGLNLTLAGWHFQFDYAYASLSDLDEVQRFTVGIMF